ncbi:hypothetical protein AB1282_24335 [Gottfriedia sp. S16(2024)]|uniref:hypothetical protein n=1 Tax=Gottfriedia sp. S16(2024) TaxID=3162883 RepID=UPI003D245CA3
MKKVLSLSAILVVILIIILVSFLRSPKWVGKTKDGNIKAVLFETQEGSATVYDGEFHLAGKIWDKNDATILNSAYLVNGKTEAGGGSSQGVSNVNDTGFVIATSKPEKNEKIEVMVEYKFKNKTKREIIPLHKK